MLHEDLWILFNPGTLIVTRWHPTRPDYPQVFKVQSHTCVASPNQDLLLTAWGWDWNGSKLVRKMYSFCIKNYPKTTNPINLLCYPLYWYERLSGETGDGSGTGASDLLSTQRALPKVHRCQETGPACSNDICRRCRCYYLLGGRKPSSPGCKGRCHGALASYGARTDTSGSFISPSFLILRTVSSLNKLSPSGSWRKQKHRFIVIACFVSAPYPCLGRFF